MQSDKATNGLVLFGDRAEQGLLLEIFRHGQLPKPSRLYVPATLQRSGLIAHGRADGHAVLLLSPRHQAITEVCAVLKALNGGVNGEPPTVGPPSRTQQDIDCERPLAQRSRYWFRTVLHIANAEARVSTDSLRWLMPDARPTDLGRLIDSLLASGLIVEEAAGFAFGSCVPACFFTLLQRLREILAPRDPRLMATRSVVPRPNSYQRAEDSAPRLFGTDVRFRNLMALAKHGPLYTSELRELTGVSGQRLENSDMAPFGRAGIVLTSTDRNGVAVQLDPGFPLVIPLRRLLMRLEERYPLPPLARRYHTATRPPSRRWVGDRASIFGGPIATQILFSIGVMGWTFEALCVSVATGYDRVVVKKALKTLHVEGILQSDRKPRPGFNVRVITIAESFAGRDELLAMVQAAVARWPVYRDRVEFALRQLPPRTKKHLQNRGLLTSATNDKEAEPTRRCNRRQECLHRYYILAERLRRPISSHELLRMNSNLYRSIRSAWPSFTAFRKDAGLPKVMTGETRRRCDALREACIGEYFALAAKVNYLPNTSALMKLNSGLSERIRIQWGGFAEFCEEFKIRPARSQMSRNRPEPVRRAQCKSDYFALVDRLGHVVASNELRKHDRGLDKRIRTLWRSVGRFLVEIGVRKTFEPRRRSHERHRV